MVENTALNQIAMPDITPAGRPTLFSDAIAKKMIDAFRLGSSKVMACHYASISYDTMRRWQIEVQTHDPKAQMLEDKAAMFDEMERAKAEASLLWLGRIEKASEKAEQWRAAAWKLERIYPHDYGAKSTLEIDANINQQTTGLEVIRETYDLSGLSDEQLAQLEAILAPVKTQVVDIIDGEVREL